MCNMDIFIHSFVMGDFVKGDFGMGDFVTGDFVMGDFDPIPMWIDIR